MHAWDDGSVHSSGGQGLWYESDFITTSVLVTLAYKTRGAWRYALLIRASKPETAVQSSAPFLPVPHG